MKIKRVSIILKSLKGKQFFKESIYKVEVMPESNSTDVSSYYNKYIFLPPKMPSYHRYCL